MTEKQTIMENVFNPIFKTYADAADKLTPIKLSRFNDD